MTRLMPIWLDGLRPAGSLLLPLTMANGSGGVLKIERREPGFTARFIMNIVIFNCAGARDRQEEGNLQKAFLKGDSNLVRSLRRKTHEVEASAGCTRMISVYRKLTKHPDVDSDRQHPTRKLGRAFSNLAYGADAVEKSPSTALSPLSIFTFSTPSTLCAFLQITFSLLFC
jgi:hypothetical protein